MPTEIERIEALEREVTELRTKVESIETDLGLIPGLITTGFRQVDGRFARVFAEIAEFRQELNVFQGQVRSDFGGLHSEVTELRTHVDQNRDEIIRAVAEIVKEGKSS